jgi:HK97 family phage prohead protease
MPPTPMLAKVLERKFTFAAVEMRISADADSKKIGGYAAVYDKESKPLGGFREIVGRSAFNKSAAEAWPGVICRFNHQSEMLLGTTDSRTLTLNRDEFGLIYEVDPPVNLPLVREWVQRGDVRKSSFAFRTIQDDWATDDGGYPLRTLTEVQLVDVAPVVDPAYTATTVGARGFISEDDVAHAAVSAGYESLAARCEVSVEEVRAIAEEDDLRRFFIRTDRPTPAPAPKPRAFGPAVVAQMELERLRQGW